MERLSSAADYNGHTEAANAESRRRLSEGDHPRTPTSGLIPQSSIELHSQTSSPVLIGDKPGTTLTTLNNLEMEAILEAYARLPPPPEGAGEDFGLAFNPHLPLRPFASKMEAESDIAELPHLPDTPLSSPGIVHCRSSSSLVVAVDATADSLEDVSGLPDASLELSQFGFSCRPSFDTSVRGLIQSRPDSPIGGQEAAPMAIKPKRSFNVGTLIIAQSKILPRIEVLCPDGEPFCEGDVNKPLKFRTAASDSQDLDGTAVENRLPRSEMLHQTSDTSPPMFTAPESPRSHHRTDSCDVSPTANHWAAGGDMNIPGLFTTDVRDFALTSDGSRSKKPTLADTDPTKVHKDVYLSTIKKDNASKGPSANPAKFEKDFDMSISKKENTSKVISTDLGKSKKGVDGFKRERKSAIKALDADPAHSEKNSHSSKINNYSRMPAASLAQVEQSAPDPEFCDDPDHYLISPKTISPKHPPPALPSALNGRRDGPAIDSAGKTIPPPAPSKDAVGNKDTKKKKDAALLLPVDTTGTLPAPDTPRLPKGKNLLNKGHMAVRRARGVVFRTPVLQLVVGRQLAPTCSTCLKLIAKGGSFETPKINPSAVPTPPGLVPV